MLREFREIERCGFSLTQRVSIANSFPRRNPEVRLQNGIEGHYPGRGAVRDFSSASLSERLAEADGGGGLAFSAPRRRDGRHHDGFAVGRVLQPVADGGIDLGLVVP